GDKPPSTVAKVLQGYVGQLRKGLGRDVLQTRASGYVLLVDPSEIDARRFEQLVEEARAADLARSADLLGEALALWRGPALADFAYEDFAQAEIARLEELRLAALEERIEADLALGHPGVLVGEPGSLIAEHPFRERLRRRLMLALYGSGRQADAPEAFQPPPR